MRKNEGNPVGLLLYICSNTRIVFLFKEFWNLLTIFKYIEIDVKYSALLYYSKLKRMIYTINEMYVRKIQYLQMNYK